MAQQNVSKKRQTIIFCNKVDTALFVSHILKEKSIECLLMHGRMDNSVC